MYNDKDDRDLKKDDNNDSDPKKTYFTCSYSTQVFLTKNQFKWKTVNIGVLDNGCPKNVVGENWIKMYQHAHGNKNFEKEPYNDAFHIWQLQNKD